jgi:hypothetical protein
VADSKTGGRSGQSSRPTMPPYRPRDDQVPIGLCDLADRHLSRATESDQVLRRYLFLLLGLCGMGIVLMIGAAALLLGIITAVRFAGLSPWTAGGLGLTGTATAIAVGRLRAARRRRA